MGLCMKLKIRCSIENPRSAYLWQYGEFPLLISRAELECNDHQVCMLGGERNKWSRWLATRGLFTCLSAVCDGNHTHKEWGFGEPTKDCPWNFATAAEAEYPSLLCKLVAQDVLASAIATGATPAPNALYDPGLTDKQLRHANRAATGKLPRGRILPPLISEFSYTSEELSFEKSESSKLLRQYHKRDADGHRTREKLSLWATCDHLQISLNVPKNANIQLMPLSTLMM